MGLYRDKILPRLMARAMDSAERLEWRRLCAKGLSGDVLEVGFGAGHNLPAYPDEVQRIHAVDPDLVGRKLAAERIAKAQANVSWAGLDGQTIALDSDTADGALSTWSLCTIPDRLAALGEIRRVLKPGGDLHFAEHGRSDEPKMARFQDRVNFISKALFGGCNVNIPIDGLIESAGFEILELKTFYGPGAKHSSFQYRGVARSTK
ncbi:MAG: ubiquinone/menaquinone biosynthesis C-methylase UbiE [Planctomycetota bacterium]|jgi:ubiquinone/menaquinone biosynthesis C-methylase UbiE